MSEAPLLEVDNLVTQYPVRRSLTGRLAREPRLKVHAVDGVSFALARGEMLALVGESGCGKTSTAQTISVERSRQIATRSSGRTPWRRR